MTWRKERVIPAIVWIACGVYLATRLRYGWNPHDEGLLAQTAERVLRGELPHRDFDDAYTGGLAMYHAGVFRVLGTSLIALRLALLAAYVAWLPIVYWIARRFAAWGPATFVMAIVAVWSVPNRVAAMPSWYNLFLATAGAAALIQFAKTRRRSWLVSAGIAGGLSVLVKLTGLAYIAAALLVLVWDEHETKSEPTIDRVYSVFTTGCLMLFVAVLSRAVGKIPGVSSQWHFVMPAAALAAMLVWREWREPSPGRTLARFSTLARLVVPFAAGIALPIIIFLIPYALSHSIPALITGALIAPGQRFTYAVGAPESLQYLWATTPWIAAWIPWRRLPTAVLVAAGAALTGLLVAATQGGPAYRFVWEGIRLVGPLLVLGGLASLDGDRWVILCMTALTSLVQFPYAGSDYFSYYVAFPILCAFMLSRTRLSAVTGAFFLAFAVLCTNPRRLRINGAHIPDDQLPSVALDIPRTGLIVGITEAEQYQQIVALVRAHSPGNGYVYSAPDLPEIPFLAQRRNPTRMLYDFLDDPAGHDARVLRALDANAVDVIVIGGYRTFSLPLDQQLMNGLRQRYPDSATVAPYTVRWRPPTSRSDVPNGK